MENFRHKTQLCNCAISRTIIEVLNVSLKLKIPAATRLLYEMSKDKTEDGIVMTDEVAEVS